MYIYIYIYIHTYKKHNKYNTVDISINIDIDNLKQVDREGSTHGGGLLILISICIMYNYMYTNTSTILYYTRLYDAMRYDTIRFHMHCGGRRWCTHLFIDEVHEASEDILI